MTARRDIDNLGEQITAQDALILNAGRDINITSTTASVTAKK